MLIICDCGKDERMADQQRYQLRHAGGKYWLLDLKQDPGRYRAPIAVNETAAMILNCIWDKGDPKAAAKVLSETYEIEPGEALADVNAFLEDLRRQGVEI